MADDLADLATISERLDAFVTRAEGQPGLRAALLADPRATLESAGVPLPPGEDVEVAEGPEGRLFVGIPVIAGACSDLQPPAASHDAPHHLDCA